MIADKYYEVHESLEPLRKPWLRLWQSVQYSSTVIIIVDKLPRLQTLLFPLSPTFVTQPRYLSYPSKRSVILHDRPEIHFRTSDVLCPSHRPSFLATGSYWGNNALEAWLDDNYSVLRGWQRMHFCVCSHHIIWLICKSSVIGISIILAAYMYPQTSSSDASSYTAAMDNTPSSSTPPTGGSYQYEMSSFFFWYELIAQTCLHW